MALPGARHSGGAITSWFFWTARVQRAPAARRKRAVQDIVARS